MVNCLMMNHDQVPDENQAVSSSMRVASGPQPLRPRLMPPVPLPNDSSEFVASIQSHGRQSHDDGQASDLQSLVTNVPVTHGPLEAECAGMALSRDDLSHSILKEDPDYINCGRPMVQLHGDGASSVDLASHAFESSRLLKDMPSMSGLSSATPIAPDMSSLSIQDGPYDDDDSFHDLDNEDKSPFSWMTMVDMKEDDDDFHDPSKGLPKGTFEPKRALFNIGTIVLITLSILMLFAGYPILHHFTEHKQTEDRTEDIEKVLGGGTDFQGNFMLKRINNSKAQDLPAWRRMYIDPETPKEAYTFKSLYSRNNGKPFQLVYSDEFNTDGRSFYPGEDPFWEAVNLNYWGTNNYEWYDPAAVYTQNGALRIQLSEYEEHNLRFRGGMIQSWNKFCYRGGLIVVSVQLPGFKNVSGLWPAIWTMGNLGRAGYGASLQGTWPYSYDKCDVGTVKNQTIFQGTSDKLETDTLRWDGHVFEYPIGKPANTTMQAGATMFNQKHEVTALSFLPGQKLSRCTCPGEDHPGPFVDGEYVGRAAPEIDVFEAQTTGPSDDDPGHLGMSQSFQMAPYNWHYNISHGNDTKVYNFMFKPSNKSELNLYTGEVTQQSMSGVSWGNQKAIQKESDNDPPQPGQPLQDNFAIYAMEYGPGEDGYVAWLSDNRPSWELYPEALRPDPRSEIGNRQYPREPMYLIMNLGISKNFGGIDWDNLMGNFPFEMSVDYIRVYQEDPTESTLSCDPKDMPTSDYINKHLEAYTNPNLTLWGGSRQEGGYGAPWPKNRLYNKGKGCDAPRRTDPGDPTLPSPVAPHVPSAYVTKVPGHNPY